MTLSTIILTNLLQLQIQINRKITYLYKLCHRFLCRRQQAFQIYAVILKPFLLKFPLLLRYSLGPLLNIFCSLLVRFFMRKKIKTSSKSNFNRKSINYYVEMIPNLPNAFFFHCTNKFNFIWT